MSKEKTFYAIFFLLVISISTWAQTSEENYIVETIYKKESGNLMEDYALTGISTMNTVLDNSNGGGSIDFSLQNNFLNFTMSSSWDPTSNYLNTGVIKTLLISPVISHLELGNLVDQNNNAIGYKAKIVNNDFIIYKDENYHKFYPDGIASTTLTTVVDASINYSSSTLPNSNNLYNCPGSGGGGASSSISIQNGNLSFYISAGWSPTCDLAIGQMHYIDTAPIADQYLGVLKMNTEDGIQDTAYKVKIENNWIVFYYDGTKPSRPSGASFEKHVSLYSEQEANSIHNIIYFDGLGRPKQTIAKAAGGDGQDIITPVVYDNFGRSSKSYLPYAEKEDDFFNSNLDYRDHNQLISNLNQYYNDNYSEDISATSPNPFSEIEFENSPLNRRRSTYSPGEDWSRENVNSRAIRFSYNTNVSSEVKHLDVDHPGGYEKTELELVGFYGPSMLYKTVVKDENWQPNQSHDELHTVEEFTNRLGQTILKRQYAEKAGILEKFDTYYVYDDYGNLTYVIPPLASDQITVPGAQGFRVASQINFPWTSLVEVDQEFANDYNKRLADYENEEILNVDIENEYGGQGGFTVTTLEDSEDLILNLNFSALEALPLKKGEILSLRPYGEFKDTEIGRIQGDQYEYVFLVRNNGIYIEGDGKLSSISQSFNSSQNLTYFQNYSWVDLMEVDERFKKSYKDQLEQYSNEDILTANIPNEFDGQGGLNITIDENDLVNVTLNMSVNTALKLNKGAVIPLDIERRLKDRDLGIIEASGYDYTFSIKENQLYISGSGSVLSVNNNFTGFNPPDDETDPETVEGLCYIYHYDARNRLIEKKIPGKGWEYIVYDKLDRPILNQDANLRLDNKWLFTKYDAFGRAVYTGKYSYVPTGTDENSGRIELQNQTDNQVNPIWSEERGTSQTLDGVLIDYTNQSFPTANLSLLTVNYYDTYFYGTISVSPEDNYNQGITTHTKGLSTNSSVRVLGEDDWIDSFVYYDEKARPIFIKEVNEYFGSELAISTEYDFIGNILQTKTEHLETSSSPAIVILDYYSYDHQNRLTRHTQSINGQSEELILENHYDELGSLVLKEVGGSVNNPLQEIDYKYNIRGWLTEINPLSNDQSFVGNDLFNFKLNYNSPDFSDTQSLYNGNISETHWKTANDHKRRSYQYSYDALDRITDANFMTQLNVGEPISPNNYSLNDVSYDKNGNILSLKRYGKTSDIGMNGYIYDIIDNLSYDYFPKSNKLESVSDTGYTFGFNDGNSGEDYGYDANGNMTSDANKSIESIAYNYLNLPTEIIFEHDANEVDTDKITYIYDATGIKLKKIVTDYHSGDSYTSNITKYINGFIYEELGNYSMNSSGFWQGYSISQGMKFFPHPEGYVEPALGGSEEYQYIYQYKDHLGNIRLSYKNNGSGGLDILEENNYYPFGLRHKGYNSVVTSTNPAQNYTYNGKEEQEELGLNWIDYGARNYDASIGRWMSPDPVSEFYYNYSPFVYGGNNPLIYTDPNGLWIVNIISNTDENGNTTYSLSFIAQKGDDLESLSTQLGISEDSILAAHPELGGQQISDGDSFDLGNINEVKQINDAINEVAKKQDKWNCANFACGSDETIKSQWDNPNNNNIEDLASILKNDYTSVSESSSKIGTIIHYRLNDKSKTKKYLESQYRKQLKEKGYSDAQIDAYLNKPEVQSQLDNAAESLVADERHFSVVVLKNKSGTGVQNIVQKAGQVPFKFKVDDAKKVGETLPYAPTPVGGTNNPYYNKTGK